MTDLTDKWKKGELPDGWYWCKCYNEEIKLLYYDGDSFELDDPETKNYYFFLPKDIEKLTVLSPVPSYEEWQAKLEENAQLKKWCEEFNALEVAKENAQLKELLKECKRQFEEVELCRYDVADTDQEDWFKISTEQAGIANKMIAKIDEVLGEKK